MNSENTLTPNTNCSNCGAPWNLGPMSNIYGRKCEYCKSPYPRTRIYGYYSGINYANLPWVTVAASLGGYYDQQY